MKPKMSSGIDPVPSVLHIITGLEVGGAERALYTLLTNGLEGPFRNRVISLMGEGHYGPLLHDAGISVTCLHMKQGKPTPMAVKRLLALVRETPTNIIQGWMSHGNLAAAFARRWANRNAALVWNQRLSMETVNERSKFNQRLLCLEAKLSKGPQAIIYNSVRSRRQFAERGYHDARAIHIPNGFDFSRWSPCEEIRQKVRHEFAVSEDSQVIGYVGRGHPQKDIPNLFEAFEKVSRMRSNAVLVAVGRHLETQASPPTRVRLLGQRADIPDLMRGFDVFCLSSRAEGFPNVLGEAMASGVPCITTNVGDAADIVGETGWVAPPRDPERLAACLDAALSCSAKDLRDRGNCARERIIKNFSIASVVDRYSSLYHSLTK